MNAIRNVRLRRPMSVVEARASLRRQADERVQPDTGKVADERPEQGGGEQLELPLSDGDSGTEAGEDQASSDG